MVVEPINEAEFSRWFDMEHMEERVRIPGFLIGRLYTALAGSPKYLNLYDDESVDASGASVYQKALQNQTDWSKRVITHFRSFHRTVGRITVSVGMGWPDALGVKLRRPACWQNGAMLGPAYRQPPICMDPKP